MYPLLRLNKMVQTSKLLAIIGTIVSILGAFFFGLIGYMGNQVYGAGVLLNLGNVFYIANSVVKYILVAVFFLFLLASIVQVFGIPSSLVAIITGAITFLFGVFIILLGYIDAFYPVLSELGELFSYTDWVSGIIPVTLDLGGVGLGAYIVTLGGALTLVSGFLPRE
jgi:hypothetical protein